MLVTRSMFAFTPSVQAALSIVGLACFAACSSSTAASAPKGEGSTDPLPGSVRGDGNADSDGESDDHGEDNVAADAGKKSRDGGSSKGADAAADDTDAAATLADAAPTPPVLAGPTKLVWVEGKAQNFDPLACGLANAPLSSDLLGFSFYLYGAGSASGATVTTFNSNTGSWKCGAPTSMESWGYATGTPAQLDALLAAPPAPFQGAYVTVPLTLQAVADAEFHYWVSNSATKARVDDIFVVHSFDVAAQVSRNLTICNPTTFAQAVAASPKASSIQGYALDKSGFDVIAHLADGTTRTVAGAETRLCNIQPGGPNLPFP